MQAIKGGSAGLAATAGANVVNSPLSGGPSSGKDATESARAPQFGEVLKQMQSKYGEQPIKPREVKKTLGKDDFLKIMITQMKNQDPTNPFKAEQMATEIAQFTSVEQLQNVNQNLNKMSNQNRPLEQMAMTNMIGKMVTIDRERFPHVEGQGDSLNFKLPKDASSVRVAIVNEAGEPVFEKDMGTQKAGDVTLTWDGLKANSLPAKSGNYLYRVDAKDERGQTLQLNPKARTKVIGVSFEGAEPVFLVGDAKHLDKVTFKSISQIEVDSSSDGSRGGAVQEALPASTSPSAPSMSSSARAISLPPSFAPAAVPAQPSAPMLQPKGPQAEAPQSGGPSEAQSSPPAEGSPAPNLFTFRKGLGSMPIAAAAPEEKGFPNGLQDDAKASEAK